MSCLIVAASAAGTHAEVEWHLQSQLTLDESPLDTAVSLSEKWIFILSKKGEVLIYTRQGQLTGTLKVGRHIDQIKVGPRDDMLYLASSKEKTLDVVKLTFIQDIDVAGSPFKGPADAPVVIAVFSDFQ